MSGGHFDYRDFYIRDIADQIERVIEENDDPSEYGDGYVKWGFSERTLDRFREAIDCLKMTKNHFTKGGKRDQGERHTIRRYRQAPYSTKSV